MPVGTPTRNLHRTSFAPETIRPYGIEHLRFAAENIGRSTNAWIDLPLITVWFLVRIQAGPPMSSVAYSGRRFLCGPVRGPFGALSHRFDSTRRSLHTGEVQGSIPSPPENACFAGLSALFVKPCGHSRRNDARTVLVDPWKIRGICSRLVQGLSVLLIAQP